MVSQYIPKLLPRVRVILLTKPSPGVELFGNRVVGVEVAPRRSGVADSEISFQALAQDRGDALERRESPTNRKVVQFPEMASLGPSRRFFALEPTVNQFPPDRSTSSRLGALSAGTDRSSRSGLDGAASHNVGMRRSVRLVGRNETPRSYGPLTHHDRRRRRLRHRFNPPIPRRLNWPQRIIWRLQRALLG